VPRQNINPEDLRIHSEDVAIGKVVDKALEDAKPYEQ